MARFLLSLLCLMLLSTSVQAQDSAAPAMNGEAPLEIEADTALVWNQKDKQYRAEGNALARQGDMEVTADTLVADYREQNGRTEIWQLTATGNVKLKSGKAVGNGDKLTYDVGTGRALLTGQGLKLVGEDGTTVTADDHFEYWSNERKATAVGNAALIQKDTTLLSPTITAWLSANDNKTTTPKGNGIDKAEANGGVTIKTKTETVTAKRGTYDGASQTAFLYDDVVLNRPPHQLNGAKAQVNLATGISQLFAAPTADGKQGRVRGIFYPGKNSPLKPQN